jgi:hypothetical protein
MKANTSPARPPPLVVKNRYEITNNNNNNNNTANMGLQSQQRVGSVKKCKKAGGNRITYK